MSRVVVHIHRLVLTGLADVDREAVARGLQAELARQLAEPQVLARWQAQGDRPVLASRPVTLPVGRASHATGVRLARALRIGGGGRP